MRASLQIAKLFGIPVRVHWTFGVLFAFLMYSGRRQGANWYDLAFYGGLILSVFFCVLLHEFGHVLAARGFGVSTRDVLILPIGGLARLERLPEKPLEEMLVALAGPAVNLLIWGFLAWLMQSQWGIFISLEEAFFAEPTNQFEQVNDFLLTREQQFTFLLLQANAVLMAFNLLPAFPMDGGRVLRASLALPIGRVKATWIASIVGQIFGVIFLLGGLWWGRYMMSIMGLMLFWVARNERKVVLTDAILARFTVEEVLRTEFTKLEITDVMEKAVTEWHRGFEFGFVVVEKTEEGEVLRGVLHDDDIADFHYKKMPNLTIKNYMKENFLVVQRDENLKAVYQYMQQNDESIIPVVENGELVGVIDSSILQRFMQIQKELYNKK